MAYEPDPPSERPVLLLKHGAQASARARGVRDGGGGEREQRQQRLVQHRGGGARAAAFPDVRR